jgi:hypothetical protein
MKQQRRNKNGPGAIDIASPARLGGPLVTRVQPGGEGHRAPLSLGGLPQLAEQHALDCSDLGCNARDAAIATLAMQLFGFRSSEPSVEGSDAKRTPMLE